MVNNNDRNWGGSRPGAGLRPQWNHGKTTVIRVPEVLKDSVIWYARLIDNQYPFGLELKDCLSCQIPSNPVIQPRQQDKVDSVTISREAVALLREGLTINSNAGGGIKKKIRAVLAELDAQEQGEG